MVALTLADLSLAALLVVLLALTSIRMKTGISRQLLVEWRALLIEFGKLRKEWRKLHRRRRRK